MKKAESYQQTSKQKKQKNTYSDANMIDWLIENIPHWYSTHNNLSRWLKKQTKNNDSFEIQTPICVQIEMNQKGNSDKPQLNDSLLLTIVAH